MRTALVLAAALALALAVAGSATAVVPSDPISRVAGVGASGDGGDGGPAILAQLNIPQGVDADAQGRLYIADAGNGRVRRVDASGNIGTIAQGLGEPFDVAVGPQGQVYVADPSADKVFVIAPNRTRSDFAGTGTEASTGDGGPASSAAVWDPRGVAADAAGNVYIAEEGGNVVRRVGPDGVIRPFAGTGGAGFAGDGGLAVTAQLWAPRDVAAAPDGSVLVVDTANARVRRVGTDGVIRTIAGNGGSGGSACPVAPTDAGATPLDFPQRAAADGAGNVYIASQGCVTKVAGGMIQRIAGNGGSTGDFGDGGPAASALILPSGVAVDPGGSLVVAAGLENKVRRVANVAPTAAFTAGVPAPLTVDVNAAGSSAGQAGEALVAFAWSFGDGSSGAGATARHVYAAAGTYTVTLTVRDDSGVTASTSGAVTVPAPPPPPPRVTITKSSVKGAYRGGRLRASLTLSGTTSGAGTTTVRLARRSGPAAVGLVTSAALPLTLNAPGRFQARLTLPRQLAPGLYRIAVGGVPVAGAAGSVTVRRPPTGILRRAFVSLVRNGPPATSFPPRTRRLHCTFDFAVLPLAGATRTISIRWRVPGALLGRVVKRRSRRVAGIIARPSGLPAGRYACTLLVGSAKAGSTGARVR